MTQDYVKFYHLENYLFTDVGPRFSETGHIDAADFYMIVIWKAERSKTQMKSRLIDLAGSFPEAVKRISAFLCAANGPKH